MRVVKWLTGLLYQLSLFVTRSWEVPFHPRQEAFVRTLASYEVVTPARVNEFGEVFPQSHHFSRRKRSSETLEPTPFRTHYRIRAYGQLFQLNLSADAAFLAAGYTEVHLGTSAHRAEERSAAPADLRHCFYRGQVNAREDHTAVFSLCGGLMGTFKAHDGEYFLEPIMKADGSEHEDDHNKPHLIYRQELKRNYFLQSHKPCDVSGFLDGEGNDTPLQYSCLENPMDGGAWWAAVHGVAKSRTRLSGFTFTFHFHALEKEMATHSSVLAWRIPGMGSLVGCRLWGRTESDTNEVA